MKYKALLFDADGTLLDFKKSEAMGLQQVFTRHQVILSDEIKTFYVSMNEQLWKGFEEGKFAKQHIFDVRFQTLLDHFHIKGNGNEWESAYREELNKGSYIIESAVSLCEQLHHTYELYIVTNGVSNTQFRRLQDSGLSPYFTSVFVSEDIGYQKPQIEYFQHVLHHVPYQKEELLLIGDTLSSDILGANIAGIASCWYNPEHLKNDPNITPTYEIQQLEDIWKIL